MSIRKSIFLSIVCFAIGLVGGFFSSRYLLPQVEVLQEDLKEEKIYQVEHNVCPVEEKPIDLCNIFVDISGALSNPGVYCFKSGDLVIDAVKRAGGFSKNISIEYVARSINLAKQLSANQKIYFPSQNELLCDLKPFTLKEQDIIPAEPIVAPSDPPETTDDTPPGDNSPVCININMATITELDSLNGIGPSTAQKIIDNRPYIIIEDLLKVSGIGEATYNKFKDNICI